jgi:hypothetical protein
MKFSSKLVKNRHLFLLALVFFVFPLWLVRDVMPEAINTSRVAGAPTAITAPLVPSATVESPIVDIFAVRSWQPPLPVVPQDIKPVLPLRPQAPPLPFRFLGKIDDAEKDLTFLLAHGDRVISTSVGAIIDRTYLVEKFDGIRLYFIYKPLKFRQSISTGRSS